MKEAGSRPQDAPSAPPLRALLPGQSGRPRNPLVVLANRAVDGGSQDGGRCSSQYSRETNRYDLFSSPCGFTPAVEISSSSASRPPSVGVRAVQRRPPRGSVPVPRALRAPPLLSF